MTNLNTQKQYTVFFFPFKNLPDQGTKADASVLESKVPSVNRADWSALHRQNVGTALHFSIATM